MFQLIKLFKYLRWLYVVVYWLIYYVVHVICVFVRFFTN